MIKSVAVNYPINGGFSTFLRATAQLSNAMGTICSHKDSFSSPSLKKYAYIEDKPFICWIAPAQSTIGNFHITFI